MIRGFRSAAFCLVFAALQLATSMAQSKQKTAPPGPIPAQILSAKNVFISNAGGDEMAPGDPRFSGGPSRAYDQFYAAMKTWNRFATVNSPAEADLLLEIRQSVSSVVPVGPQGSSFLPLFQLTIRDPRTNATLWAFHIHAKFGLGQGDSDRVFDQSMNRLVNELQALTGPITPAGETKP